MTKIVEVKDSAVINLDSNVHLGENMETNTCGCGDGGCCRPPVPVGSVGELYKSLKSGIQSARERISRRPDWNIKKKDEK